jgi:hypothetical protein
MTRLLAIKEISLCGATRGLYGRPLDSFAVLFLEETLFRTFWVSIQINFIGEDFRRSPEGDRKALWNNGLNSLMISDKYAP